MIPSKLDLYDTIPLMAYLLLATGTILPLHAFGVLFPLHTAIILLYLFVFSNRPAFGHSIVFASALLLPLFIIYLVASIPSTDPILITGRLEGAFLVTIFVATLVSVYAVRHGEAGFQRAFLAAILFILLLTILYKTQTGFFNRGQRFFLNGPIVFGWLMGMAALTAIARLVERQYSPLIGMGLAAVFTLALIWTSSKGPLIALAAAVAFIFFTSLKDKRIYRYLVLGIVIFTIAFQFLPEEMFARFWVIGRVFNASVDQSDFGSVGIRFMLWQDAITMFLENPFFGVGAGNWQFRTPLGAFIYPHNMTLELAAEIGMVGLIAYFALFGIIFAKSSNWMRATLIYFLICTSFSGDFHYYRFVMALPIGLIAARSFTQLDLHKRRLLVK